MKSLLSFPKSFTYSADCPFKDLSPLTTETSVWHITVKRNTVLSKTFFEPDLAQLKSHPGIFWILNTFPGFLSGLTACAQTSEVVNKGWNISSGFLWALQIVAFRFYLNFTQLPNIFGTRRYYPTSRSLTVVAVSFAQSERCIVLHTGFRVNKLNTSRWVLTNQWVISQWLYQFFIACVLTIGKHSGVVVATASRRDLWLHGLALGTLASSHSLKPWMLG